MKLDNSKIYKGLKKDLKERYGSEKAQLIWEYAKQEIVRLESADPSCDKAVAKYIFPAIAIYNAIEGFAPGEAGEVTRAYGTMFGLRLKKVFSTITAIPGVPTLLWNNMDKIAAKLSEGYEIENLVLAKGQCDMDIKMCPLYEKAKEHGTPDAAQMICAMDKEYMTGFRGVDYKRTKSVAEGDDCCDYRLKDSRKTEK